MFKPEAFQQPYVALRNIPYQCGDPSAKGATPSGGVLGRGQTVWTKENYELKTYPRTTTAFVDDIGIISLDPRWLVRADALNH